MIMPRHPNSGQNQNIRIANNSFENVAKFKYSGTTLKNKNGIHNEIKSRLNSGDACYFTVQKLFLLSSSCAVWVRNLVYHFRLRFFEKRVLRRILGPKSEEDGSWRKLHNDELHSLYSSPNIVRVIKSRRLRWAGHVACMGEGRREETTGKT
jgi:hypothetical protein